MTDDFLVRALKQAERSKPPVRAAALLRIARVQTAFDRDKARNTFEKALDETRQLPGLGGELLLEQARLLAAAVAPDLLPSIPAGGHIPRAFSSEMLGRIMLEHEHGDATFEYVIRHDEPTTFPFGVVSPLMQWFGDEERRLTLLRRAIKAWRAAWKVGFIWLFQSEWKVLPAEEARAVAREIVRVTLEQPDQPITATYDQEGTIQITSVREHTLFPILHVLRHLDGPLAESLIADHEQLRAAARRFPNGMESVMQEAEARRKNASVESCGRGFGMAGNPEDFPYLRALMQASQDGDFGPPIEHALERYRDDTAPDRPNQAPQEFWPSTCSFRSILYSAGKRLGRNGAVYLDRIFDADLRLFAQIELAAALAGLPELQGPQRAYRPHPGAPPRRVYRAPVPEAKTGAAIQGSSSRGPIGSNIRCPKCNWSPGARDRWFCKCGHSWNTFETGGVCPACSYQWLITACMQCREWSPHSEWYMQE